MAIILDADVIIRGEKGAFDLKRWVAARPDEHFELTGIWFFAASPVLPLRG